MSRQIVNPNASGQFLFPFSTVVTVDISQSGKDLVGSGITIGPNHVLTVAHNAYDEDAKTSIPIGNLRTTTSANENNLIDRIIGSMDFMGRRGPGPNVTNINFLANYNNTESRSDDIALFTTIDAPIVAKDVIGLIAFVDPEAAVGYTIDTAGYPLDNVSRFDFTPEGILTVVPGIPGNSNVPGRDLVRSPAQADTPGEVTSRSLFEQREFSFSSDVNAFSGQSGSGVWHTLDGDEQPRVLAVLTSGRVSSTPLGPETTTQGVLITKDIYDEIIDQIQKDSGIVNADDLPENAIIGSEPGSLLTDSGDDEIFGSYRKERILGKGGDDKLLGDGADDRLEGGAGNDTLTGSSGKVGEIEVDILSGGSGADTLVLGDVNDTFYKNVDSEVALTDSVPAKLSINPKDFALITDLNLAEGDKLQLKRPGNKQTYSVFGVKNEKFLDLISIDLFANEKKPEKLKPELYSRAIVFDSGEGFTKQHVIAILPGNSNDPLIGDGIVDSLDLTLGSEDVVFV